MTMPSQKYKVHVNFHAEVEFEFDLAELSEDELETLPGTTPDEIKDWLIAQLEDDPTFFGDPDIDHVEELTLKPVK